MPKKGEYVRFKNYERKVKSPFMIYAHFDSILRQKILESKIQMNLIQANIRNMLLAVMVIIQFGLMINLVNLLGHTYVKILFIILLILWSKKADTVLM